MKDKKENRRSEYEEYESQQYGDFSDEDDVELGGGHGILSFVLGAIVIATTLWMYFTNHSLMDFMLTPEDENIHQYRLRKNLE